MKYVQSGTTMGHWEKHTRNDKDRGSIWLHPSLKKKKNYTCLFGVLCARTHVQMYPWCSSGGERITWESQFSPSSRHVLGVKLQVTRLSSHLSVPWSHLLHVNDHDNVVIGRIDRTRQKQQRGYPKYILTSWHVPKVIIFSETPRKNLLLFLVHLFNK